MVDLELGFCEFLYPDRHLSHKNALKKIGVKISKSEVVKMVIRISCPSGNSYFQLVLFCITFQCFIVLISYS